MLADQASAQSPLGVGTMPTWSRALSIGVGCACEYWTSFQPLNVPMAAPSTTSDAQCLLWYMRERPTIVAPPYMSGPMTHLDLGHQAPVSAVTAAAAAKADVACPDGNDCQSP